MAWLTANWFWVLIGIVFLAMHLFGHGGHGGHSSHDGGDRQRGRHDSETDEAQGRVLNASLDGHQR